MKRITRLRIFYSNASIHEQLDTTRTETPDTPKPNLEAIVREWDPGIPPYDYQAISTRLKWMEKQLSRKQRRTITQTLRTPTGFTCKIYLAQYETVPAQNYCGVDIEQLEHLVNGRLANQLERGGLILLRANAGKGGTGFHGSIYEIPQDYDFDEEILIPRLVPWNEMQGVLLVYTTDCKYRVVYDWDYYSKLQDVSEYRPIATVVG